MSLTKIRLNNFRNFSDKLVEFSPSVTIILGANASGKTNVLEAINLLSTGKSFKATKIEEMIKYDSEIARVKCKVNDDVLEAVLTDGQVTQGTITKKTSKKRLLVNNTGKRMVDFASNFQTVVFRPRDLDLVTQSPSIRRHFLDNVLSLSDREYYRSLNSYEKGLRSRNKLLQKIRDENLDRKVLTFWDSLLIKNGNYITGKRNDFIDFVNNTEQLEEKKLNLEYDMSTISETRLEKYERQEVYAGTTLVGPHRDDIVFTLSEKRLDKYGSRGEQRMAVLWLKIAELQFLEEQLEQKPVLLLDDIFSELDHKHRELIEGVIKSQQTIITAADPHYVEHLENVETIKL